MANFKFMTLPVPVEPDATLLVNNGYRKGKKEMLASASGSAEPRSVHSLRALAVTGTHGASSVGRKLRVGPGFAVFKI